MNGSQMTFFIATLLMALGMGLLLPRVRSGGRWTGAVLACAGLGMLVSRLPGLGDWVADAVFYILAGVTVVSAAATVSFRNPVYSAVWFGMTLLGTAGLLLFQGAQFLAVATVVVYAGAILVTFLFVLMLANPQGRAVCDRVSWEALVSAATGAVIVGILSMTVSSVLGSPDRQTPPVVAAKDADSQGILSDNQVVQLGEHLFGRHLVAVEVAGTLLLFALVGAAVIVDQSRGPLQTGARPDSAPDASTKEQGG